MTDILSHLEKLSDMTVIHYGTTKFNPALFKKIINRHHVKPHGGFYTSPIASEYGWKEWCDSNEYAECDEKNSVKLKFKPEIKALVIDSYQDLEAISEKFKSEITLGYATCLDFEKISEEYDVIWLTEKGCRMTHLSSPLSLYGWDCETILIMNPDCAYQI